MECVLYYPSVHATCKSTGSETSSTRIEHRCKVFAITANFCDADVQDSTGLKSPMLQLESGTRQLINSPANMHNAALPTQLYTKWLLMCPEATDVLVKFVL